MLKMRQAGLLIAVAGAAVMFGGCSEAEDGAGLSSGAGDSPAGASAGGVSSGDPVSEGDGAASAGEGEGVSLEVPPEPVADRFTGRPFAKVERRLEAIFEEFLDPDADVSIARMIEMQSLNDELLWDFDTDGDGRIDDAELEAMVEWQMSFQDGSNPLMREQMDADGDGEVTPEEQQAFQMEMMERFGRVSEPAANRYLLGKYDTDADGVLSEAERAAADAEMLEQSDYDNDGVLSESERMAAEGMLGQRFLSMFETDPAQAEAVERIQREFSAENIRQQIDANGDGDVTPEEQQAFQASVQQRMGDIMREIVSERVQSQTDQFDANGDGRLDQDEQFQMQQANRDARDRQAFLHSYDMDGDGTVSSAEFETFRRWAASNSPRADANFDGVIDSRDTQRFLRMMSR